MYTSATDSRSEKRHSLIGYGGATLFCFVFQLIYEHFSHGVNSYFMMLAFLIPLIGGTVSQLSFSGFPGKSGNLFRQLLAGGIIWLTLGSLFQGVLEIYGTTNRLILVFVVVGAAQLMAAAAAGLWYHKK